MAGTRGRCAVSPASTRLELVMCIIVSEHTVVAGAGTTNRFVYDIDSMYDRLTVCQDPLMAFHPGSHKRKNHARHTQEATRRMRKEDWK